MQPVKIYSKKEIKSMIEEATRDKLKFFTQQLDKLRERINDLEQVIRIYDGKIKTGEEK